jgi:NAD-specific glutamate dehydrogenase
MKEIDLLLENLQGKLQNVLKQYQLLQKENVQLKKELEKQQSLISQKSEQLSVLHEQVDILKIGVKGWTEEEKKALEKRIDLYLKEIEKCLSILNT